MENFRDCLNYCRLKDLGFEGDMFTWCNKWTKGSQIFERLYRFVANPTFIDLFKNILVSHLDWSKSDHRPICLFLSNRYLQSNKIGFKKVPSLMNFGLEVRNVD